MSAPLNAPRAAVVLAEANLDGLLAASFENVYYVSGLSTETFAMMPHQTELYAVVSGDRLDEPRVVCSVGEAANVFEEGGEAMRAYLFGSFHRAVAASVDLTATESYVKERVLDGTPHEGIVAATVAAIEDAGLGGGAIAYDERSTFPHTLAAVTERLPNARFVPGYALFRRIRAVKTADELAHLRAALALNEAAVLGAMKVARVGISEQDMIDEFRRIVVTGGGLSTFTQIYFGRRGATGDVQDHSARLEPGDVIRFDVGCAVNGYQSDIARNFCLEEPDERTRRLYAALVHGEEVAAGALRPGARAKDAFEAGIAAVREAGIPDYRRTHVGHGIGLELYDLPTLSQNDETEIEAGMVFEVETPYYELGFAGLQPEDTVLVTETGSEFLNGISRDLEVWAT